MAQRRMFNLKVVDTDAFCEMPASAQNLYFHIGMRADDDGFYAGVKGLMSKIHASIDDLNILLARHFLLDRGDGVYVVKHWKMNNYLQNDRHTPTEYQEKIVGLFTKKDGSYTLDPAKACQPLCIQNGYKKQIGVPKANEEMEGKDSVYTSVYTGKDRIGEGSLGNSSEVENKNGSIPPSSLSVVDGSKEERTTIEWNGLDSHQIIQKFVERGFIKDEENIRSAFIDIIQSFIGMNDFYENLASAVNLTLATNDYKDESSLRLARFKSVMTTLMVGHDRTRGNEDDEPF